MAKPALRDARPFRFAGLDLVLLVLAVAGIITFAVYLPSQTPDSTAEFVLSESDVIDRSNVFLSNLGYATDNLQTRATFKRNNLLLREMQRSIGRPPTLEALQTEDRNVLAAYYWEVDYRYMDPENQGLLSGASSVFEVWLSMDGGVVSFFNFTENLDAAGRRFGLPTTSINRSALAPALKPDTATVEQTRTVLTNLSDSLLQSSLRFAFRLSGGPGMDEGRTRPLADLTGRSPVFLDSSALDAIARFHLDRTSLAAVTWTTDSLSVQQGSDNRLAHVRLQSENPVRGQVLEMAIDVSATGTLQEMSLSYNRANITPSNTSVVLVSVYAGLYGLIAFVLAIVFFRRMYARLIDVKQSMIDAVIFGVVTGVTVAISIDGLNFSTTGLPVWSQAVWRLLSFSIVAGAVAMFTFLVSGVTDSISRETFPARLRTLTLMRQGDFQNRPMGAALVRGCALGGVVLGVCVLGLRVFPEMIMDLPELFVADSSLRPVVSVVLGAFSTSFFISLIWLLGVGTALYRISPRSTVFIPLAAIVGGLLEIAPAPFEAGFSAIVVSAVIAAVLAWAFLRFDILTVLLALYVSRLLWNLSEGFVVAGSSTWIDTTLGILYVAIILVMGFVGVFSSRTGKDLKEYVPEYVTEMAGQERVKRELEIAHQVQASFLPRTMPRVENLDIAGMCLPAQEVGGDYFDFIKLGENKLAFVVGDVSGKGIQAAFFMTLVKGIIQTLSRQDKGPAELLRQLNHLFCLNAPAGTFISMIYGVVDVKERSFTFARAGHNPAIMHRNNAPEAEVLCPAGMAIGFTDGKVFDDNIEEATVSLRAGDTLVFYTDGFSEAMNSSRELYGDERLAVKVGQIGTRPASAILRLLTEDVHHFIEGAGRSDDMTMVVIKMGNA